MRKLAALLLLASAATQPAAGSVLPASALTLGLHGSDHAHSVSVVAAEGHLDLVLSHEQGTHRDHDRAHDEDGPSLHERDHVFHMTGDDAASTSPRRVALDPAPPLAMLVVRFSAPAPTWIFRSSSEPHARSSDFLRTVVLRL